MDGYHENLQEERTYLEKTLSVVRQEIARSQDELAGNKTEVRALWQAGKEVTRQDLNNQTALYVHIISVWCEKRLFWPPLISAVLISPRPAITWKKSTWVWQT